MSADRKLTLIPWSELYQADVASVDKTFAAAEEKLVGLLPRPFERHPDTFKVIRGVVDMELSSPSRRALIEMTATSNEVSSAPDDMQRLFLDLGVRDEDEIAIQLDIAKRKWGTGPRYPENTYSVTLVPTAYRPDLLGVEFNYAKQWWFLKSGTPVDKTTSADVWYGSTRVREMAQVYYLLGVGMVYDSYEVGTHGAITRYRQKPHQYIAAIHSGAAEWITSLVDSRMAK